MSIQLSFLHSYMATAPPSFPCHHSSRKSPFITQPFLSRHKVSTPTYNVHGIHYSRRLLVFAAQQSSFLKNFNVGFNRNSEEEDPASDPKGVSVVLSKRSNPLWFATTRKQDPKTVFVAGATGQFGSRITQSLLRDGFTVKAGVTDLQFAQDLAQFATLYKIVATEDARRLNAVEFEFNNIESIAKAIGNATKAVVSIGPTEDGPTSEVTTNDAFCVIEAAKLANVKHMVVVYESQGTSANVLEGISSFINKLFGKSGISLPNLINKIVELDLSYTILKASSTDDFAPNSDSNIVLKAEGRAEGKADVNNKVSKAQVASVVADIFANTSISENKTIEVATNPSAPLRPIGELLSAIPTDGIKEAFEEAKAKAKAEEEARIAAENERRAKELATQLEAEAKRLAEQEAQANELAAQVKSQAGTASIESFLSKAKDFGIDLFGTKTGTKLITSSPDSGSQKNLGTIISTLKGGINSSNSPSQKSVEAPVTTMKKAVKPADFETNNDVPAASQGREIRKIFGGLFKQETIYVDDD